MRAPCATFVPRSLLEQAVFSDDPARYFTHKMHQLSSKNFETFSYTCLISILAIPDVLRIFIFTHLAFVRTNQAKHSVKAACRGLVSYFNTLLFGYLSFFLFPTIVVTTLSSFHYYHSNYFNYFNLQLLHLR